MSPFMRQCFVTAAVCSNIIGHGCMMGYPAILFPQLRKPTSPVSLTLTQESWIASVLSVSMCGGALLGGALLGGALLGGAAAARLGRRAAHALVAAVAVVAWMCMLDTPGYEVMMVSRVLQGLSLGLHSPLRCMLIGEYSSPRYRGAFLALVSLSQAVGIALVHAAGAVTSWQRAALAGLAFAFLSLVLTLYCVESPSYLAAVGRYDDCRTAFRWLRGFEEEHELEEMILACQLMKINQSKEKAGPKKNKIKQFFEILMKKEFYKPVLLMAHLYLMMQVSGGIIMSNFATTIIGEVMGEGVDVNFWMVALDVMRLVSNIGVVFVIDKLRRRTMLFSATILNIFCFISIALYVYGRDNSLLPFDSVWIPIVLLNVHVFSVGAGMVPVPHVVSGEVYPLQYRSAAGSVGVVPLSAYMFVTVYTFGRGVRAAGLPAMYVVYAALVSWCGVVSWRALPETRGRTLADVEAELRGATEDSALLRDPVHIYKRKMSMRRNSSMIL